MVKLNSISPLGLTKQHSEMFGTFIISEITNRAMMSITARKDKDAEVKAILSKILKQPAPDVGIYQPGIIDAFWTGQSQWMMAAPFENYEDIVGHFAPKFKGAASLTEQTDGCCRFMIVGSEIERLCSLLCSIDMRLLTPGKVNRTLIEHIGCFVLRFADDTIQIIGPRSSAESLYSAICVAGRSSAF